MTSHAIADDRKRRLSADGSPDRAAWMTLVAVAAGYLVVQLAMTPVSVSLPSILRDFQGEIVLASWVMTAYFLLLTAALLPAGRIGDRLGREQVFRWGIVAFAIASALCALAPSLLLLVIARGLQGLSGALVASSAFGIVVTSFPQSYGGRVIGLVTMASSLGLVLGVLISSVVLSYVTWRVVFVATTVMALAVIYPSFRLRQRSPSGSMRGFDLGGSLLLAGGLAAVFLTLSHAHDGPETFEAGAPYHFTMNLLAVVLLVVFLRWERRQAEPLVDPRMLRNGLFATASGANAVLHMSMMSMGFLLPFLVERGMGRTPFETGLVVLSSQGATTGSTLISGWIYDRTHSPLLRPAGMVAVALGLGLFSFVGVSLGYWPLMGFAALAGLGTGVFMTPNNVVILNSVSAGAKGLGNGMIETTRQLGHGLSVAISGSIMAAAVYGDGTASSYVAGFREATGAMILIALVGVGLAGYSLVRLPARRVTSRKSRVESQPTLQ